MFKKVTAKSSTPKTEEPSVTTISYRLSESDKEPLSEPVSPQFAKWFKQRKKQVEQRRQSIHQTLLYPAANACTDRHARSTPLQISTSVSKSKSVLSTISTLNSPIISTSVSKSVSSLATVSLITSQVDSHIGDQRVVSPFPPSQPSCPPIDGDRLFFPSIPHLPGYPVIPSRNQVQDYDADSDSQVSLLPSSSSLSDDHTAMAVIKYRLSKSRPTFEPVSPEFIEWIKRYRTQGNDMMKASHNTCLTDVAKKNYSATTFSPLHIGQDDLNNYSDINSLKTKEDLIKQAPSSSPSACTSPIIITRNPTRNSSGSNSALLKSSVQISSNTNMKKDAQVSGDTKPTTASSNTNSKGVMQSEKVRYSRNKRSEVLCSHRLVSSHLDRPSTENYVIEYRLSKQLEEPYSKPVSPNSQVALMLKAYKKKKMWQNQSLIDKKQRVARNSNMRI